MVSYQVLVSGIHANHNDVVWPPQSSVATIPSNSLTDTALLLEEIFFFLPVVSFNLEHI